jgi:hypothetical protein
MKYQPMVRSDRYVGSIINGVIFPFSPAFFLPDHSEIDSNDEWRGVLQYIDLSALYHH